MDCHIIYRPAIKDVTVESDIVQKKATEDCPQELRRAILLILLTTPIESTISPSKHATVCRLFADHYNMGCIKMVYKRKDELLLQKVLFNWVKNPVMAIGKSTGKAILEDGSIDDETCHRPLRVLGFDGKGLIDFKEIISTLKVHLTTWLVFLEMPIDKYFEHCDIPIALELFVVVFRNETYANVFDVYRAGLDKPVRSLNIGYWCQEKGLDIPHDTIYSRRPDLEGKFVKAGLVSNWPRSYEVQKENGETVWEGVYPTIWKELQEAINITSVHVKSSTIGSLKNGSWSGLIGMAVRREVDVIISEVTLSARRSEYLDFTRPLFKAKYQIYFGQTGQLLDFYAIFKPFPLQLWSAILLWIILFSFVEAISYYICHKFGIEAFPRPSYGMFVFVFNIVQAFSQQGRNETPRSMSCRILFFSAYLVSSVVIPSYSASLISSLTQKPLFRPFNTLSDLLLLNSYRLLVNNNTADRDYFSDTSNPVLIQAYKQLILPVPPEKAMKSLEDGFEIVCREKDYTLFAIDTIVKQRLSRALPPCEILSTTTPVTSVNLGMAFYKEHDLQPIINYHLIKMIEFGLLKRVYQGPWQLWDSTEVDVWSELRVEEVFQMFTFLGFAMIAALIIFAIERCIYKQQQQTLLLERVGYLE